MPAGVARWPHSRERIPEWPHYAPPPQLVRLPPQFVDRPLPQPSIVTQGLNGDIDPNLVPEPEAVHDGSCRTGDANGDALDVVLVDARDQCGAGDADDAKRRDVEPRDTGTPVHGQPDLARVLRADGVKAERRQQADDAPGHALGDFGQRVMLCRGEGGRRVEAAPQTGQLALTRQPPHLLRMQAERTGLSQAEDAPIADRAWKAGHDVLLYIQTTASGCILTRAI